MAFSPNGMYLAIGGSQLSVYGATAHTELDRGTPANGVAAVAFSPSGNAIIAGLNGCGAVIVCSP